MRRRFGRGRRGRSSGEARNAPIDAAHWFERILAEGVISLRALEPVEDAEVPASFAALGRGESADGTPLVLAFSPRHGGDAALAALALAAREEGFAGEAVAVAQQWTIAARRRLALLGDPGFRFRALAASRLGEDGAEVVAEEPDPEPGQPPERAAAGLADPAERECRYYLARLAWREKRPEEFRRWLEELRADEAKLGRGGERGATS